MIHTLTYTEKILGKILLNTPEEKGAVDREAFIFSVICILKIFFIEVHLTTSAGE